MTVRANLGLWRQEFEERLTSKAVHAVREIDGIPGQLQDPCHRAND